MVSYLKPYGSDDDDNTVTVSFTSLTYTLILGVTLKIQDCEASSASNEETGWFTFLLILVNLALLIVSVVQFVMSVREQYAVAKAIAKEMRAEKDKQRAQGDVELVN